MQCNIIETRPREQGEHDPQETALRSESQLESTRHSLMELDEDKQAGKEETESARWAFTPSYSLAFDAIAAL